MIRCLHVVAILLAAACTGSGAVRRGFEEVPARLVAVAPGSVLGVRESSECAAGVRLAVIRSDSAWQSLFVPRGSCTQPAPPVDFQRNMVVAAKVKWGDPTMRIHIDSVGTTRDSVYVVVRLTGQASGCPVPAMVTYPHAFAVVPRTDLPVRWVERTVAIPC